MERKFGSTAPYSEKVFNQTAAKITNALPLEFLGKVIVDSKDFGFKKRMWTTNPKDDYLPAAGTRECYTHGYFSANDRQILIELSLIEKNSVFRGKLQPWNHFWRLRPIVIVPWRTPGIGAPSSGYDKWHEDLHFNFQVRDWRIDGRSGPSVSMTCPHSDDGNIQAASNGIEFGYSENPKVSEVPAKVTNVVGEIFEQSRAMVHACVGKFQSLEGIIWPLHPDAVLYMDCEEYFWQQFPIVKLLEHCSDPDSALLQYQEIVSKRSSVR